MPDAAPVQASYDHCRRIARAAARNFYYGILLLPREKRDALCALYAFMRRADDLADEPGDLAAKRAALAGWHKALDYALTADPGADPCLPALADAVARFGIPSGMLRVLVNGTEMDLEWNSPVRYTTFDDLADYCYHVAGAVGICCTHVFGFQDLRATDLAKKLGIAFQLTNILRDLREDSALGRVYLPQEDLGRFGVRAAELAGPATGDAFRELMRFEADRAWSFYEESIGLIELIEQDSRAALWALARVYSGILAKIEARGYDVFSARPALSTKEKTWIMLRARLGWWSSDDIFKERDRYRRGTGGTLLRRRAG
jgi:phytoene synthase